MEKVFVMRKQYTNASALAILKNGTDNEKAELAIALGFDCPDYGFAQSMCIQLLQMENEIIRGNAIIALAHIACRFRKLDKRVVKPYLLKELKENMQYKDLIEEAICEINMYLDWEIAGLH